MIDYALLRENMIESQVRPNGITDNRLIAALAACPRELFVEEPLKSLAYMDEDLAIAPQRALMEPMAFAKLVQAGEISPDDVVLDIGCGTGYSSAVLGALCQTVVAIEEDEQLCQRAGEILSEIGADNVVVLHKPHAGGCPEEAPFDVILINGRIPHVPAGLLEQLKTDGRLLAVVGDTEMAPAYVYVNSSNAPQPRRQFDASIAALPGFAAPSPEFVF